MQTEDVIHTTTDPVEVHECIIAQLMQLQDALIDIHTRTLYCICI